ELNERRINAVKLRLAGTTVAEAAQQTGLSQPTVIAAVKAYKEGGWPAVPVAPRGRGIRKGDSYPPEPAGLDSAMLGPNSNIKHLASDAHHKLATLTHLRRLEAESIHIMREVVAEAENPVMLYSIGKDSSVMLHLALKAFYPGPLPFPLLHVDTT